MLKPKSFLHPACLIELDFQHLQKLATETRISVSWTSFFFSPMNQQFGFQVPLQKNTSAVDLTRAKQQQLPQKMQKDKPMVQLWLNY
jgi:hypothetical protein